MSINSFLESAIILYENEKYDEALCLACLAVDACAAIQYPKGKNADRYKLFIKESFHALCEYGFPGISAGSISIKVAIPNPKLKTDANGYVSMEQILYHVIRCDLVHECKIDSIVQFTESTIIGDWKDKFYIPKSLVWGLINIVRELDVIMPNIK